MHVLKPKGEAQGPVLGPAVSVELLLEGQMVNALVDTGSPITIASIDCLLDVFAKLRTPNQPLEEWQQEVKDRFQTTNLSVNNYGGGEVNIIGQLPVSLKLGDKECCAIILVQKGATVDLLLGTDLLTQLGFCVLKASDRDGQMVDLLQGDIWAEKGLTTIPVSTTVDSSTGAVGASEQVAGQEDIQVSVETGKSGNTNSWQLPDKTAEPGKTGGNTEVRLLKAVRLPGRHGKIVTGSAAKVLESKDYLLNPSLRNLDNNRVIMTEALVKVDQQSRVKVLVENHETFPVFLEAGTTLGVLQPMGVVSPDELPKALHLEADTLSEVAGSNTTNAEKLSRTQELIDQLDIEWKNTSGEEAAGLKSVLKEFNEVFALDPMEVGRTDLVQHTINTGEHGPVKQIPRRIPFSLRKKVGELVDEMLDKGIVEHSSSPWASPIVLVSKQDGSTRFCVDYRRLNSITKLDEFPLPRIDDSLDLLSGMKYFSTLDLATGYWQVKMSPDSKEKTAFVTHEGLYEFSVMPFGLCNAPATFQRLMEVTLRGLARQKCVVYLDDILVMGRTFQEHLINLREVFDRLRMAGLKLKPKKCHLVKQEVKYLGYVVSNAGVCADVDKVRAVQDFPRPQNLKQLRSFLGLASYYRRFIPKFSQVAAPLYALTKKDAPYQWNSSCQDTFEQLKQKLIQAPVLAFPDFSKHFILETDASGVGLGAVLSQEQEDGRPKPLCYASRTLQAHEKNYGISELEALAVVWAVKHFRVYLFGHKCRVYTDHEALVSLMNNPHPSGKLARWGLALQELDLTIHYRPGKLNQSADGLSRCPGGEIEGLQIKEDTSQSNLVPTKSKDKSQEPTVEIQLVSAKDREEMPLSARQAQDSELAVVMKYLQSGVLPSDDKRARELILGKTRYIVMEDVLYHLSADKSLQIVLPKEERMAVFKEVHQGRFSGHLRDAKIHSQLSKAYWWPNMRQDIIKWCRACEVCASRQVGKPIKPYLTPIPVGGAFDRIGVDIIKFLRSRTGMTYAVVFVDYLTKWPEVFATADQTSPTIARLLVEEVIPRHGVPSELLSDRGTSFLSKLMEDVYKLMGISKTSTTAYHPQTDGLVERFHRTLTDMLAKSVEKNGKDWDKHLPYVLFAYRSGLQQSTGESPFYLLYGRDPRLPTDEVLNVPVDRRNIDLRDYKEEMTHRFSTAWQLAQAEISKAQGRQKKFHDKGAKQPILQVGDRVFVYNPAKKQGKAYKLARPFMGPYRILKLYDNGADLRLIAKPAAASIRVSFNRIRMCPKEMADSPVAMEPNLVPTDDSDTVVSVDTSSTDEGDRQPSHSGTSPESVQSTGGMEMGKVQGPWTGRLRKH